jgi:hypothetical protein
LALALGLAGCAQGGSSGSAYEPQLAPGAAPPAAPADMAGEVDAGRAEGAAQDAAAPAAVTQAERKLIFTGDMTLAVAEVAVAMRQAREWAQSHGGWVDAESVAGMDGVSGDGMMTLRVPQEQFEPARAYLRSIAAEVRSENSRREDVTGQYADLTARLENLQAAEVELREILSQAREEGSTAEEVLTIYRQLTEVRGQIDALQAQIDTLSEQVAMSTLHVTFLAPSPTAASVSEAWTPGTVLEQALADLVSGLQSLADAGIYLVVTSPLWLLPLAVLLFLLWLLWLLWRRLRRRAGGAGPAPAPAAAPLPGPGAAVAPPPPADPRPGDRT